MQQVLALLQMSTTEQDETGKGVMNAVTPPLGTFRLALLKDTSVAIAIIGVICSKG